MRLSTAVLVATSGVLAGCRGIATEANPPGDPGSDAGGGDAGCAVDVNDQIRLALVPTCGPCHGASSPRPFVASIDSFENLLVYNSAFVVPGQPDQSVLVLLLEGANTGLYKQMPPVGDSFAVRDQNGQTDISVQAIKDWITHLPAPRAASTQPNPDAPTTRRLTAEEMVLGLRQQLGLQQQGLMDTRDVDLAVRATDIAGGQDYVTPPAFARWTALGGPTTLASVPRSKEFSPTVLDEWVQISQDWCMAAVNQSPTNSVFFKYATPSSTSTADAPAIKQNIGYLYLSLLADSPPAGAVDDIFSTVFVAYEPTGSEVAWTAVCAYLVRHPQWMTF